MSYVLQRPADPVHDASYLVSSVVPLLRVDATTLLPADVAHTAQIWLDTAENEARIGRVGGAHWALSRLPAELAKAQRGWAVAKAAVGEVEYVLRRPVALVPVPGMRNARAELCGSTIYADPLWFGDMVDDPAVGADGVGITIHHEGGHLADCDRRPHNVEAVADCHAAMARRALGYSPSAGVAVFRRFMPCVVCGAHGPWTVRKNRYLGCWHQAA